MSNLQQHEEQMNFFMFNCGCLIQDSTGEIHSECVSHASSDFNQWPPLFFFLNLFFIHMTHHIWHLFVVHNNQLNTTKQIEYWIFDPYRLSYGYQILALSGNVCGIYYKSMAHYTLHLYYQLVASWTNFSCAIFIPEAKIICIGTRIE